MKVLVFGKTGQVARELQRRAPKGVDLLALDRDAADLSDPAACAAAVAATDADAIVNAAAWTGVDAAEAEEARAYMVNAAAPAAMAQAAAARGIPFVHISTDYVFDGGGTTPFAPDAPAGPLGAYGRTKLAGEEGVRAAGGPHAILRTSWVFSAHGGNFVKTMLRLSETRDRLSVVADQTGGPTAAADIADACLAIAGSLRDAPRSGTWHLSGAPDATWADFARAILSQAGRPTTVDGITTAEYPTPARRPGNSRLDCGTLARDFGIPRSDWRQGLALVLEELGVSR